MVNTNPHLFRVAIILYTKYFFYLNLIIKVKTTENARHLSQSSLHVHLLQVTDTSISICHVYLSVLCIFTHPPHLNLKLTAKPFCELFKMMCIVQYYDHFNMGRHFALHMLSVWQSSQPNSSFVQLFQL